MFLASRRLVGGEAVLYIVAPGRLPCRKRSAQCITSTADGREVLLEERKMKINICILGLALLFAANVYGAPCNAPRAPQTFYVSTLGNDADEGGTPTTAFRNIQTGVNCLMTFEEGASRRSSKCNATFRNRRDGGGQSHCSTCF